MSKDCGHWNFAWVDYDSLFFQAEEEAEKKRIEEERENRLKEEERLKQERLKAEQEQQSQVQSESTVENSEQVEETTAENGLDEPQKDEKEDS